MCSMTYFCVLCEESFDWPEGFAESNPRTCIGCDEFLASLLDSPDGDNEYVYEKMRPMIAADYLVGKVEVRLQRDYDGFTLVVLGKGQTRMFHGQPYSMVDRVIRLGMRMSGFVDVEMALLVAAYEYGD